MSLYDRRRHSGVELSNEEINGLRQTAMEYAAAVSTYNDHDARITMHARDFADSVGWSDDDDEFDLMEKREECIARLAHAKAKFVEMYRSVFNKSPGI